MLGFCYRSYLVINTYLLETRCDAGRGMEQIQDSMRCVHALGTATTGLVRQMPDLRVSLNWNGTFAPSW